MSNETKTQDAKFLVDEFGIAPQAAADLVLEPGDAADALAMEIIAAERKADPLARVPVPGTGKDPAHEERGIEDMEKPVEHSASAPT